MSLLQECKYYFSSWTIVITGFVLITIYFGWEGFVAVWFGLGITALVMDLRGLLFNEDIVMIVLSGPIGFTGTISNRFD